MTTPTPDPFEEPDYSSMSIMEQIAMLPEEEQEAALAGMDPEEIRWDWSLWGRPNQMPPKDDSWDVGIALAGRGYGKTRMAAEWIREKARDTSEGPRRFLLVARTAADVREVIVEGEALALDTPVASPQSPTGFIPIGKIKKGDTVVGGDGKYAKVTKVFPVLHNRPCYEIRVAGEPEPIIADANHKWLVRYRHGHWGTGRLHKTPVVRTTEEILAEFDRRWYIEPVEVQGERDIRLRYTPYNVGYILGQQPKTSEFTDHTAATRKIPEDYFWATPKIREAVLQGIVDARRSDGEGAQIPGTNTDRFRRDIRRLAASLGYRTSEYRKYSERDGVLFSWDLTRFSRRGSLRAIQSITPIESVPVRCIAVDSPDNTFLIHSTYVKTHNSGIMAVSPESERPEYRPSIRRLIWPNGNQAFCTSADEPDSLRGVQAPLDLETPISTPDGFKTLRTIDVGDYVHDENGAPARVTHVHPISEQKVYKVTFSDGSYVNATGDHGWVAHTAADRARLDQRYGVQNLPDNWGEWPSPYNRKEALTPETQKMVYDMVLAGIPQGVISETTGASVDQVKRLRKRFKEGFVPGYKAPRVTTLDLTQGHTIPATKPVQYAETAKLPLDPWVLGLALGGGKTHRPGSITVAEDDARDVVDRLNASGFPATARRNGKIKARGIPKLWDYQKEIPEEYLTASPEDRLALVQGLMDSSAVIEETGEFRFSSTDSELIDGLVSLLRSLGLLPRVTSHEVPTRLLDPEAVRLWQVQVVSNTPLVTLPRKLEMVPSTRWGRSYFERRVVSVEDVGTRLVRCITVDTESNLFLAGEGLIPTSNTHSWGDEIAAWRQPAKEGELSAWDNLRIATRLGPNPQVLATTTPKRVKVLFDLLEEQKRNPRIWLTRGSTFDNAGNLAGAYLDAITGVYGGTALAQQELYGEMLEAVDGALWTDETIPHTLELPPYTPHRVIGVDPTVAEEPGDECGIVVVSSTADKDLFRRRAWVLEDASIQGSPQVWAQKVVEMHRKWGAPVVAETNQGGALVKNAIHQIDPSIPVYEVHSKVGKKLRAEPVVLAYQQGRVTHVGQHVDLETQMITWEPENTRKSPDRIDALVHALTALLIQPPKGFWNGPIRAKGSADRQLNIGGIRNRPARTGPRATGFGQFRLGGMGKR